MCDLLSVAGVCRSPIGVGAFYCIALPSSPSSNTLMPLPRLPMTTDYPQSTAHRQQQQQQQQQQPWQQQQQQQLAVPIIDSG
jgi:hypothetical protein